MKPTSAETASVDFSSLAYLRKNSPNEVTAESVILGINCLTFVQMYWEVVLGWLVLPKNKDFTAEYYLQSPHFRSVSLSETLIQGDIFVFGPQKSVDIHKLHLAVFGGEHSNGKDPILLHATNYSGFRVQKPAGGVFETPLSVMQQQPPWRKLYGVRRWCGSDDERITSPRPDETLL